MLTNILSHCSYWGETAYLICYISKNYQWEVLKKKLLWRAIFLLKLQAVRIIQRFSPIFRKCLVLYDKLCRHILKRYIDCQKQSIGGGLKELKKSWKTFFHEDHFIITLLYQISIKNGRMTWNIARLFVIADL